MKGLSIYLKLRLTATKCVPQRQKLFTLSINLFGESGSLYLTLQNQLFILSKTEDMTDDVTFEQLPPIAYNNQHLSAEAYQIPQLYKNIVSFLIRIPEQSPLKILSGNRLFAIHTANPVMDWKPQPGKKSLSGKFSDEQENLHQLLVAAVCKHFYKV